MSKDDFIFDDKNSTTKYYIVSTNFSIIIDCIGQTSAGKYSKVIFSLCQLTTGMERGENANYYKNKAVCYSGVDIYFDADLLALSC